MATAGKSTIIAGGVVAPVFLNDDGTGRSTMVADQAVTQLSAGAVWASTEAPDTMSFIGFPGYPGSQGDLAATEAADIFAAVGFQPITAAWVSSEAKDTFAAFASQPRTGVWASTEAPDVFHGTGVGRGENGEWHSTEAKDIFAALAHGTLNGTFNTREAPDRFRGIGAGVTQVRRRRVFYVT